MGAFLMQVITLEQLLRREIHFSLDASGLQFRARKGVITEAEKVWLIEHRETLARELQTSKISSCGVYLWHALWDAGYRLRLVASEREAGYTIIPTGQLIKGEDFSVLFQLYEVHHDEAVAVLLEACALAQIAPERWHTDAGRAYHKGLARLSQ